MAEAMWRRRWSSGTRQYRDNIFVERLWRTVKYEEVYLKAYQDGRDARIGIREYF
jgi:putative transposase